MSSNGRTKVSFEVDLCDLPMVAAAMKIERNRQFMSSKRTASDRADEIAKLLETKIPPAAKVFRPGDWCEICCELYEGKDWSVAIESTGSDSLWRSQGYLAVTVGGTTWLSSDFNYKADSPEFGAVQELLAELAPMNTSPAP